MQMVFEDRDKSVVFYRYCPSSPLEQMRVYLKLHFLPLDYNSVKLNLYFTIRLNPFFRQEGPFSLALHGLNFILFPQHCAPKRSHITITK